MMKVNPVLANPSLNRRGLLKAGGLASAALGVSGASMSAKAWAASVPAIDLRVIDQRVWPRAADMPQGAPLHLIDGDVTHLWYDTLYQAWKKPGFVVAGVTKADALFVLEHLAWDNRYKVIERRPLLDDDGQATDAIQWVIAPAHPSVGG
ncbi:MAG: hypothetical protein E2598_04930 [Sphingobium sp.]|nr:hypothetical protein [Sphingobium sp.]